MFGQRLIGFILAASVSIFFAVGAVTAAGPALTPQSSSYGGVTISVAPKGFSSDGKTWDFDITLETHTQSLGDELTKSSALLADGKSYLPLDWEGAPAGGHHRKGILRFQAISPPPDAVELQIQRSGEPSARSFRWQLK